MIQALDSDNWHPLEYDFVGSYYKFLLRTIVSVAK